MRIFEWPLTLKHFSPIEVSHTDTTFTVEELYQAFKERYEREHLEAQLADREPDPEMCTECGMHYKSHLDGCSALLL